MGESIHKNASNSTPYVVPSGKFLIIYTVNLTPGIGLVADATNLSVGYLNYGGLEGTSITSPFVFEENIVCRGEILIFTVCYLTTMERFNP